jgi:nuclear pore complex protein Nup85
VAYCVRAGDATQVRRIADLVLDEYVEKGAAEFIALVDTFPPSLLQSTSRLPSVGLHTNGTYGKDRSLYSERLAFLGKYRDFHKLYSEDRLHEATAVLVSTLIENQAPERFWAVLLLDAVPLLESELMLFEEDGVMELMRYFEQVNAGARAHPAEAEHYLGTMERLMSQGHAAASETAAGSKKTGPGRAGSKINVNLALKRLEVVRLGLARCLSKSFQLENSRIVHDM